MSAATPLDLSHHFSFVSKNRLPSNVKGMYKYFSIPGIANFAGGMPHPSYFPYDNFESAVARPQRLQPTNSGDSKPERLYIPKESQIADPNSRIDLSTALQYGTADGYPPLLSFLRQFTRNNLHPNIPYAGGPDVILSCGNTDGFAKAIELFTNTWSPDRDWIHQREGVLCEQFTYMNSIQTVRPRGLNVISVNMDGEGMLVTGAGGLADVLENWDFRQGRRPHIMYTVTIGQNPTGGVLSIERKKQIYDLCQKYDIIIVEDEPYWNLQYSSAYEQEARSHGLVAPWPRNYTAGGKSSGFAFLDELAPSYLSIDTDGRVVRLDTFSKTIAPGSRCGWITAQPAVIERIARITEVTTQQPSGFVQSMIAETIMGQQNNSGESRSSKQQPAQGWQLDGWVRWLEGLRGGYERRMNAMCNLLEENKFVFSGAPETSATSKDLVDDWEVVDRVQIFDFVWPKAGMFTWVEILFENHPLRSQYSQEALSKALWVHLTKAPALCLVGPGGMFSATEKSALAAQRYLRLAFAPMDPEDVAPYTERFIGGLRSFWQRKNLDGLDDDDDDEALFVQSMKQGSNINFLGTGC